MKPSKSITLLSVPLELGASKPGSSHGPQALIRSGIKASLEQNGKNTVECREVFPDDEEPFSLKGYAKNAAKIRAWCRSLERTVYDELNAGNFPIILGGDHSLSMGSISGVARFARDRGRPLFVIWIDAHGDFHTPLTSKSGNMHGMSAAFLCGLPGFEGLLPQDRATIPPERMFFYGIRDLDPDEHITMGLHKIRPIEMTTIHKSPRLQALEAILYMIEEMDGMLHISLDIDFFDPSIAPGTGTHSQNGATKTDGLMLMDVLKKSQNLISLDLVELNPQLDKESSTTKLMIEMASHLFV